MTPEHDDYLCQKYPKIFQDRHADMKTTAMCWGFECGDGWFNLIDQLCGVIQGHIDWHNKDLERDKSYNQALLKALETGDTSDLVRHYYPCGEPITWAVKAVERDLEEKQFRFVGEPVPQVVAVQVKEKFGGLRFYYNGGDDYIHGAVSLADAMSYRICEVCGAAGEPNDGGWISTRCEAHRE